MGAEWRDCIVTMIDLPGVKKGASDPTLGSGLMRQLHKLMVHELSGDFTTVSHAYAWNDSVLLLSFVDAGQESFVAAMRDADALKRRVDQLRKSYAVAVKGRTFPVAHASGGQPPAGRVTVLEASSWAMANCFQIEKTLGKLRASWYIDGRIVRKLGARVGPSQKHKVELFPSGKPRVVHTYSGYLWSAGEV